MATFALTSAVYFVLFCFGTWTPSFPSFPGEKVSTKSTQSQLGYDGVWVSPGSPAGEGPAGASGND